MSAHSMPPTAERLSFPPGLGALRGRWRLGLLAAALFLSGLTLWQRCAAPLLPAPLQPFVANPFPLLVRGVGSEYPIGGKAQTTLKESSVTAYEVGYTGTDRKSTRLNSSHRT